MPAHIVAVVFPAILDGIFWMLFSLGMISYLRTECKKSYQPQHRTNLDLMFPRGAATARWLKVIVGAVLTILAPIVVLLVIILYAPVKRLLKI